MMEMLEYLERIECGTGGWRRYVERRAVEVQSHIDGLRRFAGLRPGRLPLVEDEADMLQRRLDSLVVCGGCGGFFDPEQGGWIETEDGDFCPTCSAEWNAEQEQEMGWQREGLA